MDAADFAPITAFDRGTGNCGHILVVLDRLS